MKDAIVSRFYFWVIWLCTKLFTNLTITGRENLPNPADGGLLIVSNHFTIFEVPFLATRLPIMPTFFATQELLGTWWLAPGILSFREKIILTNRGNVDRKSLSAAIGQLKNGGWLSIFPEGGITREIIEVSNRGDSTRDLPFSVTRGEPVVLLEAKSGVAWMAVQAGVPVVPIAFEGTENVQGELKSLGRTKVKMHIGKPIGPFKIPAGVRGTEKKQLIDQFGHQMMQAVADLLDKRYRGEHYV